ncbi:MAG: SxtJ family membrane protein [Bacteroidota bacterium]|jgi:hypothetical protein
MAERPHSLFGTVRKWWMAFANAIGWFSTRLLLTIFYFIILAFPAIILKLIRKDLLDRSFRDRSSYWIDKLPSDQTLEQAKRQF